MRLGRQSSNIEDRRGMGGPLMAGGGIGAVVIALVVYFLGGDPNVVLQQQPATPVEGPTGAPSADDPAAQFVAQVLADTEDTWNPIFREQIGAEYQEPRLVLFTNIVQSACGTAQAASGPFYCPLDQRVYIDLGFYQELRDRFKAPGDFAQAYVIAHEVGHHVQTLLGISQKVHTARQRMGREEGNELSVRQELQADCFAGVWANHAQRARNILEQGDVEEGLNAASAIGDDRIQRQTQGQVIPESFTHGSSEQRVRWFRRGLENGTVAGCNTFETAGL
jgi:predicted metalloprotease